MLSSVVKHDAIEVADECITLSETNVQTSSHLQEAPYRPADTRRVFNAIPLQKKPNEDKDDVVIIEEGSMPEIHDAKPYVFPTLNEKENEYIEQGAAHEQLPHEQTQDSGADAEGYGQYFQEHAQGVLNEPQQGSFEEPFDNALPHSHPQPELKSLYEDIVSKSIAESSRILEEAHAKAQADYYQLIENGKAEIEQAKKDGFQQGIAEGTRSQVTSIRACIEQLEHTVARIEGKQEEYFAACEQDLKWLSLEIAQKVLNQKLSEDELALYPLVAAAVAKQKNVPWLTVEISDNAPELLQQLKAQLEKGDEGKTVSINSVQAPAGTCRLQTADGFIDASIYRQLDNLRDYFAQQLQ